MDLGGTYIDTYAEDNGVKTMPYLTERFQGVWKLEKKLRAIELTMDISGNTLGPLRLPTLGELDPRHGYSDMFSIVNIQLTKDWNNNFKTYGGIKNILDFTPPANSIARSFDPFDRKVVFDRSGNAIPSANNPYALTFDPTYVYASNQGVRFFFGMRLKFD